MGYIPGEVVEEVRSRFDIVEVISSYIDLRKTGKNYVGFCPFHSEKNPSFTVSPEKQIYYCFGCQNGGNLFSFIMQMENCSFPDAVRFLAQRSGINVDPFPASPAEQKARARREMLLQMYTRAQKYYQDLLWKTAGGKEALNYLLKRGLTNETILDFGLGYAPQSGGSLTGELRKSGLDLKLAVQGGLIREKSSRRFYDYFRGRLIFPIGDSSGRVIAFGGRIVGRGEPKYLNTPESPLFNKRRILYGLHSALPTVRRKKEALLVEGYLDVITLHQHGLKEAVAPLGTALTEDQLSLLRGRVERIYLVFDADTGGETAALRGLELFKNEGCQIRVARLPRGKDPADFVCAHGGEVFRQKVLLPAGSPTDYRLYLCKKRFNLKEKEGRISYWQAARKVIGALRGNLEREEYLKKIAGEINVSLEVLREDLENKIRSFSTQGKVTVLNNVKKSDISPRELVERELLSYLIRYPDYLQALRAQEVKADSFLTGPHREIARYLFDLEQGGYQINEAVLLSYFSGPEMQRLIMQMAVATDLVEEVRVQKAITDCLKKIKTLHWAAEREMLIKSLQDSEKIKEISATLKRISELKKWEEELYRSGEGEDLDV